MRCTGADLLPGWGFGVGAGALAILGLGAAHGWVTLPVALTLVFVERAVVNGGSVGGYECAKFDIATGANAGLLQGLSNTFGALAGVSVSATETIVGHGGWSAIFFVIVAAYTTAGLQFYVCFDAKPLAER